MQYLLPGLALWLIGVILLCTDYKRELLQWTAALTISSGFGYMSICYSVYIHTNILIGRYELDLLIRGIMYTFSHHIPPISLLMLGITYSGVFGERWDRLRKPVITVLLIPVILMYFLIPIYPDYAHSRQPESWLYYLILSAWVVPYATIGNYLLWYGYRKEKNLSIKKQMLLTFIVVVPVTMYGLFSNYVIRIFAMHDFWRYNWVFVVPSAILIILFGARYGVLGYRLKYEKHYVPIERVFDSSSDSFIIVNEKNDIVEINKTFIDNFGNISKDNNLTYILDTNMLLKKSKSKINESLNEAKSTLKVINFEEYFSEIDKYFKFEVTPITFDDAYASTLILLKDITEHKKIIQLIEENQSQIIENARLESLGNLIGSIAHNLKTPLMSSSGAINLIDKYVNELQSVHTSQSQVDTEPIVSKIKQWEGHIRDYLVYMNDVIGTVKGQIDLQCKDGDNFNISELTNRIDILMKDELKKNNCILKYNVFIYNIKINGPINYMLQVLNILISNAIDSYEGNQGIIELNVTEIKNNISIEVKDFGKGIPEVVKNKIFNQMVTTKGKDGSGLGLYITKSIVKTKFKGNISFESDANGSMFKILLPKEDERVGKN